MRTERTAMIVNSVEYVLIAIAENLSADDVPRLVEPRVRLVNSFARLFAMRFVREPLYVREHLVDGAPRRQRFAVDVLKDFDASLGKLLDRVARLSHLAAD